MKLRIISVAVLAIGMSLTSCKDDKNQEATSTQTNIQTNDNSGTTAALNPAHGQPGHRCEIPVGAPLDQAPASTLQQQQQTTSPVSTNSSPVRLNTSTANPLKNPPHGQPGHDCAVPVGADLPQQ